jgi:nucleolar protein 56
MSSTNFYLLFESSSGFSLFQVLENEEIGNLTVEVQISMMDFSKFQKMVKMIGFHPFDTAENALENMNAITEHELTDELKVINLHHQFDDSRIIKHYSNLI